MQDLKTTKIKEKNSLEVKSLVPLMAYLLPLANFFTFNFSFSTLPDIISDNTPIFFFIKCFRFLFGFYIIFLYPSY